jgi:ADP-ribose pyrophosphatase
MTTKIIRSNSFVDVEEYALRGNKHRFFRAVSHKKGVTIIPLIKDKIILERQYRYNLGKYFSELPGGGRENDEDVSFTAQREFTEETGFKSTKPKNLFFIYTAPEFSTSRVNYLICKATGKTPQSLDPTEIITTQKISTQKALAMIKAGKINNNISIIGILYYMCFLSPKDKKKLALFKR